VNNHMDVEKEIEEIKVDIRLMEKEMETRHKLYMSLCDRSTKTEKLLMNLVDFLEFHDIDAMKEKTP